jgi:hypothetical protein
MQYKLPGCASGFRPRTHLPVDVQKLHVSQWTKPGIDAECGTGHSRYDRALAIHYTHYFAARPELAGEHRHCAKDIASALPPDWASLASEIEPPLWHRHYRSGKSSQVLGLALLGVAAKRDPTLSWLWPVVFSAAAARERAPDVAHVAFERELPPELLNEQRPRVTSIDFFVDAPDVVVCAEMKWAERGIGSCSCGKSDDEGDPLIAECSTRVLNRPRYWKAAANVFHLPPRMPGSYCPISTPYQAVRNVAAAQAIANGRKAVFLLIYDETNPYFHETGDWPGWPIVLGTSLEESETFAFRAVSWQKLVRTLPLDEQTKQWAQEKHRLTA